MSNTWPGAPFLGSLHPAGAQNKTLISNTVFPILLTIGTALKLILIPLTIETALKLIPILHNRNSAETIS